MKNAKQLSLMSLQREYLEKTLEQIDELLALSDMLSKTEDVYIIEELQQKINILDAKADENYKIACDIEHVIKR